MREDRDVFSSFLSQRHVVKGIAGLTLAAGLAACGSGSAQTTRATPTIAPTSTPMLPALTAPITTLFTYRGHTDTVNQVAWSFDNALIAS